jgi:hypothetical protein
MAGMDLPEYLKGKDKKEVVPDDAEIDTLKKGIRNLKVHFKKSGLLLF